MMNIRGFGNQDGNAGGGGDQPSCTQTIKNYWSQVPLFVRIVVILSSTFYLLSWFTQAVYLLITIPALTIGKLHLWTIVTSVFVNISIINIFFAFFAWLPDGIKLEKENGTVKYMMNFFINSMIIQCLFLALAYLISLAVPAAIVLKSAGLWPLILTEITLLCLANPEAQLMMFLVPCPIKARYFPWALFGFFTVINMFQTIQIDILAGILYGYAYFYYLREKIQLSDNFLLKVQGCFLCNKLSSFTGFVPIQALISPLSGNIIRANVTNVSSGSVSAPRSDAASTTSTQPSENRFVPFKGKAVVVGTGPASASQNSSNMPDIIIESNAMYQQLNEEESTSEEDRQRNVANLIKKAQENKANNAQNSV